MPITLVGITMVVFFLTRLVPGGPVERMLQEQAIGALVGEKAVGQAGTRPGNDELERLEELFNLQEPIWKAAFLWEMPAAKAVPTAFCPPKGFPPACRHSASA